MSGTALLVACLLIVVPAFAVAAVAGAAAAARFGDGPFLAIMVAVAALAVPELVLVLLGTYAEASAGLAFLLFPPVAGASRAIPAGTWRTGRALGGGRFLVFRVLLLPTLALPAGFALCLGLGLVLIRITVRG